MDKVDLLWRQYQQHIDTYKFYLEISVKLMGVYFAVSGAMLSFYFTHTSIDGAKFALYLPWLMSIGLWFLFTIGAFLSKVIRNDVFALRDSLKLEVAPDLGILTTLLWIFSLIMVACITGLTHVLWFQSVL
jgi:hypothetical protein